MMPINKIKPRNIASDAEELLDVFYIMFAGEMFEAQTKGEIKPFAAARRSNSNLNESRDEKNSLKRLKTFLS